MVVFLPFWWSRTPTFHFSLFSGYIFVFLIHYVSYFPCFLVFAYPDISFLTFFGVHFCFTHTLCFIFSLLFSGFVPRYFIFNFFRGTRLLTLHLLWLQHNPIHRKRTPLFHFSLFSGYAPTHTSLIVASAQSYSPKTYPAISFFIFLWVRTFSHFTYCVFSTLLFTENVPRHFIFYISLGTLLNCLTYFPPPLCTKGYRVALASTRYPSTNSLTFYIHISIYQYSHFYISIFTFLYINIHPYCLPFRLSFGIRLLFASMNIFPIYAVIFIYEYLPHLCCHFYICTYS